MLGVDIGTTGARAVVFEPSGRYLGRVAAPARATVKSMRGDHIWVIERDSLDVQQVIRYRVVPGFGEQRTDAAR